MPQQVPGQGAAGPPLGPGSSGEFLGEMKPRTAAMLCYIPWFGWLAAILVLASQRFKHDMEIRFHAFQGLYLFVAWLIADWILVPALTFSRSGAHFPMGGSLAGIVKLAVMAGWVVMLIKTSKNERFRLPLIGEWAERSVNEQRL